MTVITNAPEAALLLVVVGFLVGAFLFRYRYRARIENMKGQVEITEKRLSLRDDEIAKLGRAVDRLEKSLETTRPEVALVRKR